jgi:two-component system sensor histidine kinase/response regulator
VGNSTQKCLLLVEDDPRNMMALEALLSPHGHRLVRAADGETAIEMFESEAPDIVLCDLLLPGTDGVEVLGRIRAHPLRSHTPVIMITAYADRERRLRALRAGADEFLEKPIDDAILTARLNTLLRLKRSRDELAARNAKLEHLRSEQRALLEFILHDMTAPRRGMTKALDWIEAHIDEGGEVVMPAVAELRDALDRVDAMVGDLAWVSRLETGAMPVRRESVALNGVVRAAARRFAKEAVHRQVEIDIARIEHVAVPADERLVQRVLENLIDNALRYAAKGGGRVRVELRRRDGAEIRVHDDGPGVAQIERARIFEKFMRGAADPPSPGHAGLGLYFCRRAIDAHQGEISLVDVPGWSTCFCVWLPDGREPFTARVKQDGDAC